MPGIVGQKKSAKEAGEPLGGGGDYGGRQALSRRYGPVGSRRWEE